MDMPPVRPEYTGECIRHERSERFRDRNPKHWMGSDAMPRKMSIEEAHEFLDSKPGWIALTTIGPDGFPHTVPLGYFRLANDIVMGVRGNTRKLKNIRDNPKVSLLLESGKSRQDIKGLMVQGTATVHAEAEDTLHYAREAARLRGVPEKDLPTEPRKDAAYIKVTPTRFRSWDYSVG